MLRRQAAIALLVLCTAGVAHTQQAAREQHLHHLRNAAGVVQVCDNVTARGFQIAYDRHAFSDCLEVIECEFNAGRMSNRRQM